MVPENTTIIEKLTSCLKGLHIFPGYILLNYEDQPEKKKNSAFVILGFFFILSDMLWGTKLRMLFSLSSRKDLLHYRVNIHRDKAWESTGVPKGDSYLCPISQRHKVFYHPEASNYKSKGQNSAPNPP